MSVNYHNLLRRIAYNVGGLRGERTPELATSYAAPLTAAELAVASPPLQVLMDSLLLAEEEFVLAISSTGNHPWRAVLRAFTSDLADKAVMPAVDSTGKGVVGVYGVVRDSTDNTPLRESSLAGIDRRVRNAGDHYLIPAYLYKFDGAVIRHTRPLATVEVCSYDRSAQADAITANDAMLLPDTLEAALVDRATCLLNPAHKPEYADAMVAAIKAGNTSVVPKSVPLPVTLERAG